MINPYGFSACSLTLAYEISTVLIMKYFTPGNALLIVLSFLMVAAISPSGKKLKRRLEIRFHMKQPQDVEPSYQMAIWLEKPDGTYAKTLFVTDYLSYGGFNLKRICSDWQKKIDWRTVSNEETDAVTGATPDTGAVTLTFDASKKNIPPGMYKFFIEVHLSEDYNELYSGEINIGGDDSESTASVKYIPEKHPVAGDILSDVVVKYINK